MQYIADADGSYSNKKWTERKNLKQNLRQT